MFSFILVRVRLFFCLNFSFIFKIFLVLVFFGLGCSFDFLKFSLVLTLENQKTIKNKNI